MKYGVIFLIFGLSSLFKALNVDNSILIFFLVWLTISLLSLSLVYFLNKPKWLGKDSYGDMKLINILVFLPWLLFSITIWHIVRVISNESKYDEVVKDKIWCSRKLLASEFPKHIEVVIDLTSEFSEPKSITKEIKYFSIPLLDGIEPNDEAISRLKEILPYLKNKKILIHCVQGHGRTATMTIILLKYLKQIESLDQGINLILEKRKLAKVSSIQLKFLQRFFTDNKF